MKKIILFYCSMYVTIRGGGRFFVVITVERSVNRATGYLTYDK